VGISDLIAPVGVASAQRLVRSRTAKYTYRPAVVVRLTVRLEDFSNDDGPDALQEGRPAKTAAARAAATAAFDAHLQAVRRASGERDLAADTAVVAGRARAGRGRSDRKGAVDEAAPLGKPGDGLTVQIAVIPTGLSADLNGFKTADKVTVEVPLADFPVLPDVVRALLVEVFWGTVAVDDYQDPGVWVPQVMHSAPVFRGYADEESLEASDDDLRLTIEAYSLEKRLIDAKFDPFAPTRRVAKGGEDLADYVRKIIAAVPEFNGTLGDAIGVRYFPNVDPAKAPRIDAKRLKRSLQTASSRAAAGGQVQASGVPPGLDPAADPGGGVPAGVGMPSIAPQVEVTVWDLVTRACLLAGMIPVYDPSVVVREPDGRINPIGANNILIVPPQNLKETPQGGTTIPGGPADGFERTVTIGGSREITTQVRLLVWGKNIRKYKVSRKYGRTKRVPRVRVLAHNPDGRPGERTLEAVFPKTPRATIVSAAGTGPAGSARGHQPIEEEVVRVIREVRTQAELERVAVALYHTISQHEVTATIETDELSSYLDPTRPETHNENPDLLRLRPGACVRIMVARQVEDPASNDVATDNLSQLMDRRANPAFIRKALLENPASRALVAAGKRDQLDRIMAKIDAAYQSAKLTDWFYVRSVCYRWDAQEGFQVTVEVAGYQEARNNPASLSAQDKAADDHYKAKVSGKKPDARAAALQANQDALLLSLAERAAGGGG